MGGPPVVIIPDSIKRQLGTLYRLIPVEWAACLQADKVWDGYFGEAWIVVGFSIPEQEGNERLSIRSFDCTASPGYLHTHPEMVDREGHVVAVCHRSATDRKSFWRNGADFEVVLCADGSYRWYTRNGEQGGEGYGAVPRSVRK
jgi:hypothetical protein